MSTISDKRIPTPSEIGTITIPTNKSIEEMFHDRVLSVLRQAFDMYGLNDKYRIEDVDISYHLKGRCAGRGGIKNGKMIVWFNMEAIEKDFNDMYEYTIPHEVAHLIANLRPDLRARSHNKGWKRIDRELGGNNKIYHSIPLTRARKTVEHIYDLPGYGIAHLGSTRHNRLVKGERRYWITCRRTGHSYMFDLEYYTGRTEVKS